MKFADLFRHKNSSSDIPNNNLRSNGSIPKLNNFYSNNPPNNLYVPGEQHKEGDKDGKNNVLVNEFNL